MRPVKIKAGRSKGERGEVCVHHLTTSSAWAQARSLLNFPLYDSVNSLSWLFGPMKMESLPPVMSLKKKDTNLCSIWLSQIRTSTYCTSPKCQRPCGSGNFHHLHQFCSHASKLGVLSTAVTTIIKSVWRGKGLFQLITVVHHKEKVEQELKGESGGRN